MAHDVAADRVLVGELPHHLRDDLVREDDGDVLGLGDAPERVDDLVAIRNTTAVAEPAINFTAAWEAFVAANNDTMQGIENGSIDDPDGYYSEDAFYGRLSALYPDEDGATLSILVNGHEADRIAMPLAENGSDWHDFAIPLDSFDDYRLVDPNNDSDWSDATWVGNGH
nr:hypothetical protein [Candidatus Sigynarchaeum springense]